MEKTAMQELIELMEKPSIHPVRQEVKEKAIELLGKERQQILSALNAGYESTHFTEWADYYEETYKS